MPAGGGDGRRPAWPTPGRGPRRSPPRSARRRRRPRRCRRRWARAAAGRSRKPTASASVPMPMTSTSSTTAASGAFSRGRIRPASPLSRASMAMRQRPLDRPHAAVEGQFAGDEVLARPARACPAPSAKIMPRAMGRSKAGPSFLMSAGARLMTVLYLRPVVAGVAQGRPDAFEAFLHGRVRQADDGRLVEPARGARPPRSRRPSPRCPINAMLCSRESMAGILRAGRE